MWRADFEIGEEADAFQSPHSQFEIPPFGFSAFRRVYAFQFDRNFIIISVPFSILLEDDRENR